MRILFITMIMWQASLFGGFIGSTLVHTPHGLKPIQDLKFGDMVLAIDQQGTIRQEQVIGTKHDHAEEMLLISLHSGHEFICDYTHKVYNPATKKWVEAQSLKAGDLVVGMQSFGKISHIQKIHSNQMLYDISITGDHSYCICPDGVCVHNFVIMMPVASWIIGEGLVWLGGAAAAAAVSSVMIREFFNKLVAPKALMPESEIQDPAKTKAVVKPTRGIRPKKVKPKNVVKPQEAQAPGKPTEQDGYTPPKKWDGNKIKHPESGKIGYPDEKGFVWVPTGPKGHGGPHWDIQYPNSRKYDNVYPGGVIRYGKK